jgi:hypothetical protein
MYDSIIKIVLLSVLAWVTKLAMEDNIEKVTGPMLVKLLEERELLAAYFYDGSMTNDVRYFSFEAFLCMTLMIE